MGQYNRYIDKASAAVIVITLVLFVAALLTKGFTHELLLEAGVFLVSVKLIIAGYKSTSASRSIDKQLIEIKELLHNRQAQL